MASPRRAPRVTTLCTWPVHANAFRPAWPLSFRLIGRPIEQTHHHMRVYSVPVGLMLGCVLAALVGSCAGATALRTARHVHLPAGRTETVHDTRYLLLGRVPGIDNRQTVRAALSGAWEPAYRTWEGAPAGCVRSNNAGVAAALLGRRAAAITLLSQALRFCPDDERVRENARLVFTDGVPVRMPPVDIAPGALDRPIRPSSPKGPKT